MSILQVKAIFRNKKNNFERCVMKLLLMTLALSLPNVSFAFSNFGHQLICQAAFELSEPATQQFVEDILKHGDPIQLVNFASYKQHAPLSEFARGCTWPDVVRKTTHRYTNRYHFMNVPKGAAFNHARDCSDNQCVTQAIKHYALKLSNKLLNNTVRKHALFFLGHFIADIHQPLHVGNTEDKGGNTIKVFANPSAHKLTSLHWIWDKKIPEYAGLYSPSAKQQLLYSLSQSEYSDWLSTNPVDWALESHDIAQRFVYLDHEEKEMLSEHRLEQAYYERAKPIITKRFKQAALRLALMLELIAKDQLILEKLQ